MNEARLEAFLKRVDQDPLLNDQVNEILAGPAERIPEKLAHISAKSDAPITADEFRASFKERKLSESELADIAGGGPGMRFERDYDHTDTRSLWQRITDKFN